MSDDIYTLAKQVIDTAGKQPLTIATAESCTGGGIGAALTAISGSSNVYVGGVISYADDVKINLLGVDEDTIDRYGAVSRETAIAMAEGARRLLATNLAISVTGIAGPMGGTKSKPVGTVWIGLAQKGKTASAAHYLFTGKDRESVRNATIVETLKLLMQALQLE